MTPIKSCITCHHRKDSHAGVEFSRCALAPTIDLVTGDYTYRHCSVERLPGANACGPGGDFWSPINQIQQADE
jgi:hypothetical protein